MLEAEPVEANAGDDGGLLYVDAAKSEVLVGEVGVMVELAPVDVLTP